MKEQWTEIDRIDVRFTTYQHLVEYLAPLDRRTDIQIRPSGPHEIVIRQLVGAKSVAA